MPSASLLSSGWPSVLSALPSSLDLAALARSEGAIKRGRRISDGETLLRLALWYGPCGLSLRSAARKRLHSVQIMSFEQLAVRLAGGFARPIDDEC